MHIRCFALLSLLWLSAPYGIAQVVKDQPGGTAEVVLNSAKNISPEQYGVRCDGQVFPIMGLAANGNYLGTAVVGGHDDTATIQAWLNALAVKAQIINAMTVNAVGVSVESGATTTYQALAILPYASHCLVTSISAPFVTKVTPSGTFGNDVTTAAGDGPSFVSMQNSGQYFVGDATGNPIVNGISARAGDTWIGGRIVYAGPVGNSTGTGFRVDDALDENFSNVHVYGFKTCMSIEAVEYSHIDFNQMAHCGTGLKVTTGWTTPGGASMPGGGVSIDNQFFGDVTRLNKINLWLNGAAANRFYAGTASFASVANIVFGANPPNYISAISLSNASAAVCPANSTEPITFTDPTGAGVGAEGVITVNSSGVPTGAYSTNGGMNYSLRTTAAVPGCSAQPGLAPVVATTSGMGAYDGAATQNTGSNFISRMDMESEGVDSKGNPTGRPATGFQILFSLNAGGNTVEEMQDNIGSSPREFTRFARDLSGSNFFKYNQVNNLADPATSGGSAVSCMIENGTVGRTTVLLAPNFGNIATYACYTDNKTEGFSAYFQGSGWDANGALETQTLTLFSGSAAATPYTTVLRGIVPGTAADFFQVDGSGAWHFPQTHQNGLSGQCATGTLPVFKGGVAVSCR